MDASDRFSLLQYNFAQAGRIMHSAMAAEALALAAAHDVGYLIKYDTYDTMALCSA